MYIDLISLLRLHFMFWYFRMIEDTMILFLLESSNGACKANTRCSSYTAEFPSIHPWGTRLLEKEVPTEVILCLRKVCLLSSSSPLQLRLLCLVHSGGRSDFESSKNSTDLISLSFLLISVNNSLTECFPTLSLLIFTIVAFRVESLLDSLV